MSKRPVIALTCGDIAGIGPEVVVKAVADKSLEEVAHCIVIGNSDIIQRAIDLWCPGLNLLIVDEPTHREQFESTLLEAQQAAEQTGNQTIVCLADQHSEVAKAALGTVSAVSGDAAFRYLATAIRMTQARIVDAIATAPLNKEALHEAGHHFPGHTEILADRCGVTEFAMMLHLGEQDLSPFRKMVRDPSGNRPTDIGASAGHGLSVAHVTLHTSIASIPDLLTSNDVFQTTELMHGFLKSIGCERAAIAVAALNPHGGENGLFGIEEAAIIEPAVLRSQRSSMNVLGPLPIDTLIRRSVMGEFDGVVAMYHDQGHIPVKLMGFDSAINVTLGLPIVRTSPTHGTAFDKAWNPKGLADPSGMKEAVRMAAKLSRR